MIQLGSGSVNTEDACVNRALEVCMETLKAVAEAGDKRSQKFVKRRLKVIQKFIDEPAKATSPRQAQLRALRSCVDVLEVVNDTGDKLTTAFIVKDLKFVEDLLREYNPASRYKPRNLVTTVRQAAPI